MADQPTPTHPTFATGTTSVADPTLEIPETMEDGTTEIQPPSGKRTLAPSAYLRIGVWLLAALAALFIWIGNPTDESATLDGLTATRIWADTSADTNFETAESAPQQQVVNGWHSNDLLDLITEQNNLMLNSQVKIVGLLMVFVVAYSADRVGTTLLHRT